MPEHDRVVYMEYAGRRHNVYESLVEFPPEDYRFVESQGSWDNALQSVYASDTLYRSTYKTLTRLIPLHLLKGIVESRKHTAGIDITFATGHAVFRNAPWVVDMEVATQLAGYDLRHLRTYRRVIEKRLASKFCKAILPWTEKCRETLARHLDCSQFRNKIQVLRHAVRSQEMHSTSENRVRLLFVGSANYNYIDDFIAKGGPEVFALYDQLSREYDNLYLAVRSKVPQAFREKYESDKHVSIFENVFSWRDFRELFVNSDIFIFPTHGTPARAFLDAMSFGLPIVTSDVWANSEFVSSGENGFLIRKTERIPYLKSGGLPNTFGDDFMHALKTPDERVMSDYLDALRMLIDDASLRMQMSNNSFKEVESGKFSINIRNQKLKEIFDDALH